jgi:hypothetical protein
MAHKYPRAHRNAYVNDLVSTIRRGQPEATVVATTDTEDHHRLLVRWEGAHFTITIQRNDPPD